MISLKLGYLILGGKRCLILHENDHYKGIILSDAALLQCNEKRPSWPTSASYNIWKNSSVNSSLCSVCEKCNDNAFIQCDLCKCWTHKNCMSDFYNPEIMSERNQHFFCKFCIEKINFRFERYYYSKQSDEHFATWFFSYNVLNETIKMREHLIKIKRK